MTGIVLSQADKTSRMSESPKEVGVVKTVGVIPDKATRAHYGNALSAKATPTLIHVQDGDDVESQVDAFLAEIATYPDAALAVQGETAFTKAFAAKARKRGHKVIRWVDSPAPEQEE